MIVPDAAGKITSYTDANGFTLGYQYDEAGNLWKLTYPDGTVVTYGYDPANRLTSVTNWLGESAGYGYDDDGRLETFTQFNGIATIYGYDAANRLVSMGSAVADYQFTLDADGNRVHSNEAQPLTPSLSYGPSAGYVYNLEKNRLLSAGPLAFTYDDEGRLVSSGGVCRVFDWNGRLVQIGNDAEFSYDGLGNRIVAVRAGVVTRYVYDPWGNLMAEADANGITRKYIYGKGLIAVATASARYCYHFNGIGSATALTDMSKNLVNAYAYDPFGRILLEQEAIQQPFKYVGQYGVMAEPSGLYYMRARYYDPNVGRFISEDPLGFGGGDVNLYAYALNNPVNWIDPFGLSADVGGGHHGQPIFLPVAPVILSPEQLRQMHEFMDLFNPLLMMKDVYNDIDDLMRDLEREKNNRLANTRCEERTPWIPPRPDFDPNDPENWWKKPTNWDNMNKWQKTKWYIGKIVGAWGGNI